MTRNGCRSCSRTAWSIRCSMGIGGENVARYGIQVFAFVWRAAVVSRVAIRRHVFTFIGPDITVGCSDRPCSRVACGRLVVA